MTRRDLGKVRWSFSAFVAASACPRRWALSRQGPSPVDETTPRPRPATGQVTATLAALRGRVIHSALERMVGCHADNGGPAWGDASLSAFWRKHFPRGVSGVVRDEVEHHFAPITKAHGVATVTRLRREIDEAFSSLVTATSALLRLTLSMPGASRRFDAWPEEMVAADISEGVSWIGYIDLVMRTGDVVMLIDYKTGVPSDEHLQQLRVYACLFERDVNKRELGPVTRIVAMYPTGLMQAEDAPLGESLVQLRNALVDECRQILEAAAAEDLGPRPAPDHCRRCTVRLGCDAYWTSRVSWPDDPRSGELDVEASIRGLFPGGRSVEAVDVAGNAWHISVADTTSQARVGDRVRAINARRVTDPAVDTPQDKVMAVVVPSSNIRFSSPAR